MTTAILNAGKAVTARAPRAQVNRHGIWETSVTFAKLAQLTADALVPSAFLQNAATAIPVLLFMQDSLALLQAVSFYSNAVFTDAPSGHTVTFPSLDFNEFMDQIGNVDAAPITSVITGVAPIAAQVGERVSGTTPTNAVPITGFAYAINLEDQSLVDNLAADLPALVSLLAISKSGVPHGPLSTGGPLAYDGTGTAFADRTTVILRESDYTQAMRDNGNVYTDTNGLIIDIVGLHAIPAAPQ